MSNAESVADEVRAQGRKAHVLSADLSDSQPLAAFVDDVWNCFDGVDIWVNNAGADLLTGEEAQLDFALKLQKLLDVDVRSTLLLSRLAGERMLDAGRGVILNIGWDQAERGMEGASGELFAA